MPRPAHFIRSQGSTAPVLRTQKEVVFLSELHFHMDQPHPMPLEQFLRRHKGVSHRMLVRLKRIPGGICCNGAPIRTIDPVQPGDEIILTDCEAGSALVPSAAAVPILGETDSYIVYNKPAHMPVHPSQGHHDDTLGNVFAAQFPHLPFRPVYRLDSGTSGICLIAKSAYAAKLLQGSTQKTYFALVCGVLSAGGTISAPIGREDGSVIRRCVRRDGKPAVTHYTPLRHNARYTLLSLELETGRTHQIRVHMAYLGHPLAGDTLYGGTGDFSHHMLHCGTLEFSDPETGAQRRFAAPWAAEQLL